MTVIPELVERPTGFIAPNLSPIGLVLEPKPLAEGVWALMANEPPKDNNGLIVGSHAALVVDSGVTPRIGRQIQELAGRLTDVPIRYLANTTYHGDHTFGNTAFGPEVTVVTSRLNRAAMTDIEAEKAIRRESMYDDKHALDGVVSWRYPDLVFDRFCEIDLGGRVVQLWHFGHGNGSGDTIVYVPDAKVAWTGNFLGPAGVSPMLLAGDPVSYVRTLRALQASLDVRTIVPGHGFVGEAEPALAWMINHLERLTADVAEHRAAGETADQVVDSVPLRNPIQLPPSPGSDRFAALNESLHRLNVLSIYRWLDRVA